MFIIRRCTVLEGLISAYVAGKQCA